VKGKVDNARARYSARSGGDVDDATSQGNVNARDARAQTTGGKKGVQIKRRSHELDRRAESEVRTRHN